MGSRANNLEIAIIGYSLALEVSAKDTFPYDWASVQNSLGIAYRNRIRGEKAQNLERAIAAYEMVLEVYTKEAFPVDWAMTQNNLAIAYSDRIRGEKAQNLERAIAALEILVLRGERVKNKTEDVNWQYLLFGGEVQNVLR